VKERKGPRRHRWVKIRTHVYVCRVCGTARTNSHDENGWFATWHRPDGSELVGGRTPACTPGPRTGLVLEKYAVEIAAAVGDPTLPAELRA
jgi:hypothetical protein